TISSPVPPQRIRPPSVASMSGSRADYDRFTAADCRLGRPTNEHGCAAMAAPFPPPLPPDVACAANAVENDRQNCTRRGCRAARCWDRGAPDAKAVVLDLVDPAGTERRLFRRLRQAGLDGFMREDGAGHGLSDGSVGRFFFSEGGRVCITDA